MSECMYRIEMQVDHATDNECDQILNCLDSYLKKYEEDEGYIDQKREKNYYYWYWNYGNIDFDCEIIRKLLEKLAQDYPQVGFLSTIYIYFSSSDSISLDFYIKYPNKTKLDNKYYEKDYDLRTLYEKQSKYIKKINEEFDRDIIVYSNNKYYLGNRIFFQISISNTFDSDYDIKKLDDISFCQKIADSAEVDNRVIKETKKVKKISEAEAIDLIHQNIASNKILILENGYVKEILTKISIDINQYDNFSDLFKENIKIKGKELIIAWKNIIENNQSFRNIESFLYDVIEKPLDCLFKSKIAEISNIFDEEFTEIIFFNTNTSTQLLAKILYKCLTSKYIFLYENIIKICFSKLEECNQWTSDFDSLDYAKNAEKLNYIFNDILEIENKREKINNDSFKIFLESIELGKNNNVFNTIYFNSILQELYKKYNKMIFRITGVVHRNIPLVVDSLCLGMNVNLIREPENQFDSNAIRIENETGVHLGYVPKNICTQIQDIDHHVCKIVSIHVKYYRSIQDLCPDIIVEYKKKD